MATQDGMNWIFQDLKNLKKKVYKSKLINQVKIDLQSIT